MLLRDIGFFFKCISLDMKVLKVNYIYLVCKLNNIIFLVFFLDLIIVIIKFFLIFKLIIVFFIGKILIIDDFG